MANLLAKHSGSVTKNTKKSLASTSGMAYHCPRGQVSGRYCFFFFFDAPPCLETVVPTLCNELKMISVNRGYTTFLASNHPRCESSLFGTSSLQFHPYLSQAYRDCMQRCEHDHSLPHLGWLACFMVQVASSPRSVSGKYRLGCKCPDGLHLDIYH